MAQQLNLFDARFARRRQRFSARQGALGMAAVLALAWGGQAGLRWAAERAGYQAQQDLAATAPLRAQLVALTPTTPGDQAAELAQLQALNASQRRVRAALEAGAAGVREGHADYLSALARQASGQLWITGFGVSEDGNAIDLEGRMTDAAVLADYLRKLNAEPRFKGRPFAQLSLKAGNSDGDAQPYTEFALRSSAATTTGSTP